MCTKRTGMVPWVLWALCMGLSCSSVAAIRFWHTLDGKEFQGEFSKVFLDKVYFKGPDGQSFSVKEETLVDTDLTAIKSLIPPEIQIKFSKNEVVNTDLPRDYDSGIWDDYEVEVSARVVVKKMGKLPYHGVLRGEVYLIAEEIATDDYRLFAKKGFSISFPDKTTEVECQLSESVRNYFMRGEYPRGAHYKGYVVIVEDLNGKMLAFKSDLNWMDEENIPALRKISCPGFMNEKCKKRSVPRPESYRDADSGSY